VITVSFSTNNVVNQEVKSRTALAFVNPVECVRRGLQGDGLAGVISVSMSRASLEPFNLIQLTEGGVNTVAFITEISYENDNNTLVSYVVDEWHTMLARGISPNVQGNLTRCTTSYASPQRIVNMIPENIGVSDTKRARPELQDEINNAIRAFEGSPSNPRFVLWISERAHAFLNATGAAFPIAPVNAGTITQRGYFGLTAHPVGQSINTLVGGEYVQGVPYAFTTIEALEAFIGSFMTTGYVIVGNNPNITAGSWWSVQQINANTGVRVMERGQAQSLVNLDYDSAVIPVSEIVTMNASDLYRVNVFPPLAFIRMFNQFSPYMQSGTLSTVRDNGNLTGRGAIRTPKLLTYPYTYYEFATSKGTSIPIIPQTHVRRADGEIWELTTNIDYELHLMGGYTPRLMMRVITTANPDHSTRHEWLCIREYPTIPVTLDATNNISITRELELRLNTIVQVAQARESNIEAATMSHLSDVAAPLLNLLGRGDKQNIINPFSGRASASADNQMQWNTSRQNDRQAVISSMGAYSTPSYTIGGKGGLWDLLMESVPVTVYQCGGTNYEIASLDDYCNVAENVGGVYAGSLAVGTSLFGGHMAIGSTNFLNSPRTFYKMFNISVSNVPERFGTAIKNLFKNGVFLLN
jgi:hypothetical protein